ncbi:MAG: hypothetical protein F6K26_40840 [Moorea sp. SIO2I5]|nr:hypothetical protein [Moorena sp. SIO2I5]
MRCYVRAALNFARKEPLCERLIAKRGLWPQLPRLCDRNHLGALRQS